MMKDGTEEKWICEDCLIPPELRQEFIEEHGIENTPTVEEKEPSKCMACKGWIRRKQGIFCKECGEGVHKSEKCSKMKRKQREHIGEGKVKCRCEGCIGVIANPYPKEDDSEVD